MKKLITLSLTLLLAAPAFAQKYLKEDINNVITNPKVGYGLCQDNQTMLLSLLIKDSEYRVGRIALEIEEEKRLHSKKARINIYTHQMYEILMNQVMLSKLKEQLETKGLYNLIQASEKNKTLSVLQLDNMQFNIEQELLRSLNKSLDQYTVKEIAAGTVNYFKEEIYKELLKSLVTGPYKAMVSAELKNQIARFMAGQISKQVMSQALKTGLTQFGKVLLADLGRGAIVELLTLPLTSFVQPEESKLIDLMEEIPELMINPEWINPQGSKYPSRYAWRTHCLAILRKPKTIEAFFNRYRNSLKKEFASEMAIMRDLADDELNRNRPAASERSSMHVNKPYPAARP